MNAKRYTHKIPTQAAFTLIELLAVIAVIGILAAILIPAISKVREKAKISNSVSNLRQIGTNVAMYSTLNNGELPIHLFAPAQARRRNWILNFWEMNYSNQTLDWTPDSEGRVLPNTIFFSPMMETNKAREGQIVRSYGWNEHARFNFRGSDTWPRLNNVAFPSRSILAGDTTRSSAISATNNQVNFRNNGQAAFLFVDGHVELRGPDEVPNNSNHVFWGGSILSEAEE